MTWAEAIRTVEALTFAAILIGIFGRWPWRSE